MDAIWNIVLSALALTGVRDVTVWQDVAITFVLLPIGIWIKDVVIDYLNKREPLSQLLDGYIKANTRILIYLSHLTACDDMGEIRVGQKYFIAYPEPLAINKNNLSKAARHNIDPVWSEGDGECLAEVYNVLGKAGKTKNIQIANIIHDWGNRTEPIISIGFNPKTEQLEKTCYPIFYEKVGIEGLKIKGNSKELFCSNGNEVGIIQKTYIQDQTIPVFILAGMGTLGTSSAGGLLGKIDNDLGKLFGNRPFCVLFSAVWSIGPSSAVIRDYYPEPSLDRILLHLPTYIRFKRLSNLT